MNNIGTFSPSESHFSLPLLLLLFLNFIQYSKRTYGSATAVSDSETREINIDIIRVDSLSKIFVGKKDHCKN